MEVLSNSGSDESVFRGAKNTQTEIPRRIVRGGIRCGRANRDGGEREQVGRLGFCIKVSPLAGTIATSKSSWVL